MEGADVLYLSESDVKSLGFTMRECIEVMEEVFNAHGNGRAIVPTKLFLDLRKFGYTCDGDVMPAYIDSCKACGMKWIGGNPQNYKLGLPYLFSVLILNDPRTFQPLAIISANWLTALRTGAVTAVIARHLAPSRTENVCIIGAGLQGRYQLLGLNEVLKIANVTVFDIRKEAEDAYVREMSERTGLNVVAARSIQEAVSEADVIITATTANEDLVEAGWMRREGYLLCSIGTYRELGYETIKAMDKVIVDHRGQAKITGTLAYWFSKGMLTDEDVYAELGEIVSGKKAGRESDAEKILCVPTGMGSQDLAVAQRIYEMAKRRNVGQWLKWTF